MVPSAECFLRKQYLKQESVREYPIFFAYGKPANRQAMTMIKRRITVCARPMFAAERLVWLGEGAQVRYRSPWSALQEHRVGQQRPIELRLSASELLDRIVLLIPPPRKHRHHYFGVLAPNSPWREVVTAQAGRNGVQTGNSVL